MNVFREKYGGVPGDYNKATTNISATAAGDGNGDGYIYQGNGIPTALSPTVIDDSLGAAEYVFFWNHLGLASLIDGVYTGDIVTTLVGPGGNFPSPKTGAGGIMAFSSDDGLNYWHIGVANPVAASVTVTVGNILTPVQAQSIDTKMDDGAPNTGIVKARGNATIHAASDATALTGCITGALNTDTYQLANLAQKCQLRIRMN